MTLLFVGNLQLLCRGRFCFTQYASHPEIKHLTLVADKAGTCASINANMLPLCFCFGRANDNIIIKGCGIC